jgi:hypothetical protein
MLNSFGGTLNDTAKFKKTISQFGEEFMNKSMKILEGFQKRDTLNDPV